MALYQTQATQQNLDRRTAARLGPEQIVRLAQSLPADDRLLLERRFADGLTVTEIARRSRRTPRLANNRLHWVRDYAQIKASGKVSLGVARDSLDMIGIDRLGLDKQDRNYLDTLIRVFGGGPSGLEAIAHTMNVSSDTLEDEVEPFLLRSESIVRTRRGRLATARAFEHMKMQPPAA